MRGNSEGKVQREQYELAMGFGYYKWYQSQTLGDVLARRLSPKGRWTQGGVPAMMLGHEGSGLGGPTSIGEGNKCQRGRWAPKGVDCEIPHRLRRMKHQGCENFSLAYTF